MNDLRVVASGAHRTMTTAYEDEPRSDHRATTRTCHTCGQSLPQSAFSPSILRQQSPSCRVCRRLTPQEDLVDRGVVRFARLSGELRGWAQVAALRGPS